jgi:hypothetical protein
MPNPHLLERYSERLRISPEEARTRLFYECVQSWKRGFVRLHNGLRPGLYRHDWRLVEEAGKATSRQEVLDALDRWNHRSNSVPSYARDRWNWRVSGRRLLAVAMEVFKDTEEANAPSPVELPAPSEKPATALPKPSWETAPRLASATTDELARAHG